MFRRNVTFRCLSSMRHIPSSPTRIPVRIPQTSALCHQSIQRYSTSEKEQKRNGMSLGMSVAVALLSSLGAATAFVYNRAKKEHGKVVYTEPLMPLSNLKDVYWSRSVFMSAVVPISSNVFVAKLVNGDVLVYAPAPLGDSIRNQVEDMLNQDATLHILVPNNQHTMFIKQWHDHFVRQCKVYIRQGNSSAFNKLDDHKNVVKVSSQEDYPASIRNEYDISFMNGVKLLDEVVLLHKSSKYLICADAAMRITQNTYPKDQPMRKGVEYFYNYIADAIDKLTVGRELAIARPDQEPFQKSVKEICDWEFHGVFMAHGEPIYDKDTNLAPILYDEYKKKLFK